MNIRVGKSVSQPNLAPNGACPTAYSRRKTSITQTFTRGSLRSSKNHRHPHRLGPAIPHLNYVIHQIEAGKSPLLLPAWENNFESQKNPPKNIQYRYQLVKDLLDYKKKPFWKKLGSFLLYQILPVSILLSGLNFFLPQCTSLTKTAILFLPLLLGIATGISLYSLFKPNYIGKNFAKGGLSLLFPAAGKSLELILRFLCLSLLTTLISFLVNPITIWVNLGIISIFYAAGHARSKKPVFVQLLDKEQLKEIKPFFENFIQLCDQLEGLLRYFRKNYLTILISDGKPGDAFQSIFSANSLMGDIDWNARKFGVIGHSRSVLQNQSIELRNNFGLTIEDFTSIDGQRHETNN